MFKYICKTKCLEQSKENYLGRSFLISIILNIMLLYAFGNVLNFNFNRPFPKKEELTLISLIELPALKHTESKKPEITVKKTVAQLEVKLKITPVSPEPPKIRGKKTEVEVVKKKELTVEEEPLREDKKISMNNEPDKNRKAKVETEKSLAAGNKETEKEVGQEKEQKLSSQSKSSEYLKGKLVQEDFYIASQEADYKDEGQVKKNPEIEKMLDFTRNNYPDNVNPPELLEFQLPVYPKNLRERDIEGKIILKVLINKEGKVQEIQIFESSGYKMFDHIAIESVWQWRFKPAKKEDRPGESWVLIPINFQIK